MLRNILPWYLKKFVHVLFCVLQTNLGKAFKLTFCVNYQNGSEIYKWYNVSILEGLGWESCMVNSKGWSTKM